MRDEELQRIVEAVVRRLQGTAAPAAESRPGLVVLMTGAEPGLERAAELIARLTADYDVQVILAGCYTERYPTEPLVAAVGDKARVHAPGLAPRSKEALVDAAAAVLLLLPLRTTVAKVARGMADSPPAALLTRALMAGKPCFSAAGELDPEQWPATIRPPMRHGQGSLAEMVEQDLARLASWGMMYRRDPMELLAPIAAAVRGASSEAASAPGADKPAVPLTSTTKRVFITADDIRALHQSGQRELVVGAGALVTDEARSVAAALHVHLKG